MSKREVPWTEAFLAMLSLIVVLIFILIYYCILPCVKYYKRRREEEEAWWQTDPRWNKDTFTGAVSAQYNPLRSSSSLSCHSASPNHSFRGGAHHSNLPEIVTSPKDTRNLLPSPKANQRPPPLSHTMKLPTVVIQDLDEGTNDSIIKNKDNWNQ